MVCARSIRGKSCERSSSCPLDSLHMHWLLRFKCQHLVSMKSSVASGRSRPTPHYGYHATSAYLQSFGLGFKQTMRWLLCVIRWEMRCHVFRSCRIYSIIGPNKSLQPTRVVKALAGGTETELELEGQTLRY